MKSVGMASIAYGIFVILSFFNYNTKGVEDYITGLEVSTNLLFIMLGVVLVILGIADLIKIRHFIYFSCGALTITIISCIILRIFTFGVIGSAITIYLILGMIFLLLSLYFALSKKYMP